jgi:hypothetical protein
LFSVRFIFILILLFYLKLRVDAQPQIIPANNQWDKLPVTTLNDPAFSGQLKKLVLTSASGAGLSGDQEALLQESLSNLVRAYSAGSYTAYQAFRFPPGETFYWATNSLGSITTALKQGHHIALHEAFVRWYKLHRQNINWDTNPPETNFAAYVKLYGGETIFSHYFTGLSFETSRIVFTSCRGKPLPAWATSFFPAGAGNRQNSTVAAPQNYPNRGYFSQKKYSFARFENSLEKTEAVSGSVTIADCFLFLKRAEPDKNIPLIVRFYWEPKLSRWLPDDLVICNLAERGKYWPVF